MCGAYSAGDQGEATTYYQLPAPPSLQPCTWIGPPAPPFLPSTCHFFPSLQICSLGKVKAGRSRFQFLQAIQKSTNCAKYASIHPHGYPPAHIAFWESAKKSGIVWKSIYPVVTQTMQRVDMIWEPATPSCEDGVAKVRHLVLWLHKWSLSAVKEGHALNGSGPRNPSSPSDVSETRVKYKRQKEQWIKSHLYFCSAAFVTQGPLNSVWLLWLNWFGNWRWNS